MGGNFVRWLGFGGVAVAMAFQPALAGERKEATIHRAAAAPSSSARHSDFGGSMRSSGNNHASTAMKVPGRGELPFFQVTPFESRAVGAGEKASRQREEQKASGPTTPHERKTVTLLRFNPNVAVQPIFGGVNGAQLSVGF
jgi:hypothetical protein